LQELTISKEFLPICSAHFTTTDIRPGRINIAWAKKKTYFRKNMRMS